MIDVFLLVEKHTRHNDQTTKEHHIDPRCMSRFYARSSSRPRRECELGGEYHDYVDLSIVVAQPKGLTILALRDTETIGLADHEEMAGDTCLRLFFSSWICRGATNTVHEISVSSHVDHYYG